MKNTTLFVNGIECKTVTKTGLKMSRTLMGQVSVIGLFIVLLLNFSMVFSACTKNEKAVLDAYELRINGKIDDALSLLKTTLAEDSTNATAHFELARTLNYMNMMGSKEADNHLKKALELEPDNVVFAYYNAKNCFLKAYISAQQGKGNTKELVNKSCNEFIRVLGLNAEYPEALMYLVEFYGMLPDEMGGNKTEAKKYADILEKVDKFYGAKARLVMMPEGTDIVKYWTEYISENGEDCKVLKELGVAYLFNENIEGAKESFEKAMAIDMAENVRLLDLARYHMMKVMQNRNAAETELPKAKEYLQEYLKSIPEPIAPLKAYAIGMLVKIEMFSGNKIEGQQLMQQAKALDPYFSRATAIPSLALFEPPTEIDHHFQSYFIPY